MGIEQTRYLVITDKETKELALERFHSLIMGFPELGDDTRKEHSFGFVVGENKYGIANGKLIKNNYKITNHGNGNWVFIFEWNTVAQFGEAIEAVVNSEGNEDLNWCTASEVAPFFPSELVGVK